MEKNKRTILHGWHIDNGANMALFGGYDMPLWYSTGVKTEHLAVLQTAGIFDTSHMAVVMVKGTGARELLQFCFSKDLEHCQRRGSAPLINGRSVYGVFLDQQGHVIDDAIVSQLQADIYMVVVNAGMGGIVSDLLRKQGKDADVTVDDLTDRAGKMDIQGPNSAKILGKIVKSPEKLFDKLHYFFCKGAFASADTGSAVELLDGTQILVSRTGYTGEFGFELFTEIEKLASVWSMVLEAGQDLGVVACGLAARDSLRAGAVLPLSHQDIGDWPFINNPWQFALPWRADKKTFTKQFAGGAALLKTSWQKYTLPFCGFDPRKIAAAPENYVTTVEGERLGKILTCTTDMAIGRVDGEIVSVVSGASSPLKGLGCGFVLLDKKLSAGQTVMLSDGKRNIKVEIRDDIRPQRSARTSIKSMLRE